MVPSIAPAPNIPPPRPTPPRTASSPAPAPSRVSLLHSGCSRAPPPLPPLSLLPGWPQGPRRPRPRLFLCRPRPLRAGPSLPCLPWLPMSASAQLLRSLSLYLLEGVGPQASELHPSNGHDSRLRSSRCSRPCQPRTLTSASAFRIGVGFPSHFGSGSASLQAFALVPVPSRFGSGSVLLRLQPRLRTSLRSSSSASTPDFILMDSHSSWKLLTPRKLLIPPRIPALFQPLLALPPRRPLCLILGLGVGLSLSPRPPASTLASAFLSLSSTSRLSLGVGLSLSPLGLPARPRRRPLSLLGLGVGLSLSRPQPPALASASRFGLSIGLSLSPQPPASASVSASLSLLGLGLPPLPRPPASATLSLLGLRVGLPTSQRSLPQPLLQPPLRNHRLPPGTLATRVC